MKREHYRIVYLINSNVHLMNLIILKLLFNGIKTKNKPVLKFNTIYNY